MTVTLTLNPELEAELVTKAKAKGLGLQDYLQDVIEQDALLPSQRTTGFEQTSRLEAVRNMIQFGKKNQLTFGEPITRDLLHEGHRI